MNSFQSAQHALASTHTITLPRSENQLWIVTDGAVTKPGIGATIYMTHRTKSHILSHIIKSVYLVKVSLNL
jgi:hypothetical protein